MYSKLGISELVGNFGTALVPNVQNLNTKNQFFNKI